MFAKSGHVAQLATPKKLLIALAAFMLLCALSLTGCGSDSPSSSSADGSSAASSQAAAESIEATVTITDADGQPMDYTVVTDAQGATVLSVIQTTDADVTVEDGQYGTYISAINGQAAEGNSGWVYTVNGEQAMDSVDVHPVVNGDSVEISYITM